MLLMFLVHAEIKIHSQFIGFSQEAIEDSSQLSTLTQRTHICTTAWLYVATTDKDEV